MTARQAVALTILTTLVFLAATFIVTRGPWVAGVQISDVPDYERYGEAIAAGELPYRDVAIEYPPGALAAFVLPALARDGAEAYAGAFAWLMRLCGIALIVSLVAAQRALAWGAPRAAGALALVALSPLLLGRLPLQRFDLLPTALSALAIALLLTRRDRAAFAALALGVGTKLYPVVALPIFAVAVWRRRGWRPAVACVLVFAGVLAAMVLPFAALAPDGFGDALVQQADRPLHRESTAGAALLALHQVGGLELQTVRSHGSQNFAGDLPDVLASLSVLLQLAALAGIWLLAARERPTDERVVRLSAAALVAFVVMGKVLSPQFLIWLLALVPLVAGRRGIVAGGLLATALIATQLYFPRLYLSLADLATAPSWLIVVRDALLLALLAALLARERAGRSRPWAVRPATARRRSS